MKTPRAARVDFPCRGMCFTLRDRREVLCEALRVFRVELVFVGRRHGDAELRAEQFREAMIRQDVVFLRGESELRFHRFGGELDGNEQERRPHFFCESAALVPLEEAERREQRGDAVVGLRFVRRCA